MFFTKPIHLAVIILLAVFLLAGCGSPAAPVSPPETVTPAVTPAETGEHTEKSLALRTLFRRAHDRCRTQRIRYRAVLRVCQSQHLHHRILEEDLTNARKALPLIIEATTKAIALEDGIAEFYYPRGKSYAYTYSRYESWLDIEGKGLADLRKALDMGLGEDMVKPETIADLKITEL